MSRTQRTSSSGTHLELTIDFSTYGFELDPSTPQRASVDLVRDSRGFAVDIGTETAGYHAELRHRSGSSNLNPVRVYRGSALIASEKAGSLPDVDDLPEWIQFVIEHATETEGAKALTRF